MMHEPVTTHEVVQEAYDRYRRAREARENAQAKVQESQMSLNVAYRDETLAEAEWEALRRQELENHDRS